MVVTDTQPVLVVADRYGAPLADFYYLAEGAMLYVHWHGNLTAEEVVRAVSEGSKLLGAYSYSRVLNDKRDTSGDWSDALPWLEYEWLPQAVTRGVRAIAYLLSPDLESQIVSQEFMDAISRQLHTALFLQEEPARQWLLLQQ
ncbi:hypothetical protein GCM10022409_40100 [Hymenobacter glaciei]|uniref:Uncharacterized protein n=1 Tax=Hymenobacter glaciei TaxID=877209 RepID=A0ABP7UPY9_9BACT